MLFVAVNEEILTLNTDSLQRMAEAVELEKVHYGNIRSLVFRKDGKYYLFTLSVYLCINYDLYGIM